MIKRLLQSLGKFVVAAVAVGFVSSATLAYIAPNDARSLTFNSGELTLYMGQQGSSFYLDSIVKRNNVPVLIPLSCEVKAGNTLLVPRRNCDDISFSYYGSERDIKIYVQLDNDQGTWTYNTSSRLFTDARRGIQDVTDYDDTPVYNNGYISLSTNGSSFQRNEYIDLIVRMYDNNGNTDTSNRDQVRFTVLRQSGNSYYTASSSDYDITSSTYRFTSSDRGYVVLDDYIRFTTSGTYKIRVENTRTNTISETIITIRGGNSNTSTTRFDLSTNNNNPSQDQYTNLTMRAVNNNGYVDTSYNNTVKFEVYRRQNSSNSWSNITSSSTNNSNYRISDTTYRFYSSDNGVVTLNNFIKFYSDSYDYKVRVVDTSDSSVYGEIVYYLRNSGGQNTSNVHRYVGELVPRIPSLNTTIDVKITAKNTNNTTVTNMTNRVNFSLERRVLPTSTRWTSLPTSSCRLLQDSYTFTYSDYGEARVNDVVRCSQKGFYRLKITDNSNTNVLGYLYFTIVDVNDFVTHTSGFTRAQKEAINEEYRTFMAQVNDWEAQYQNLSYNTRWTNLWRRYYNELNKLVYNKEGRLVNYAAYVTAKDNFTNSFYNMR